MNDNYVLSPLAQADLSGIWDYSCRQWGIEQADHYVLAIRDTCEGLASARLAGQSAEGIRAGYRKQLIGSHVLFFRKSSNAAIEIVRILHQRMDVTAHL